MFFSISNISECVNEFMLCFLPFVQCWYIMGIPLLILVFDDWGHY